MTQLSHHALALLPVLLFVGVVIWMDVFSLTKGRRLVFSLISGSMCFVLTLLIGLLAERFAFSHYFTGTVTAIIAELLKGLPLLYLVQKRKIVLMGDATIYGTAVGAGYAIAENIHIVMSQAFTHATAVILGFEAAVMHIGCSSLLAYGLIIAKQETSDRSMLVRNLSVVAVFAITITIHIIHNIAPINPLLLTSILVVYFVISKRHIFKKNEASIHSWIDQCLNNDVALLASIKKGELTETNAGKYLLSIKDAFKPEVFFDICCYISEYLELSITAKSNLLLKEAGFPTQRSKQTQERITELKVLRKSIGRKGVQALKPIVDIEDVDRWAMESLL